MPRVYSTSAPNASQLVNRLTQALAQERIIQRFVDSYVIEHSRHAIQVHAGMYRDLLTLLQREALLAACISVMAFVAEGPSDTKKPQPLTRKDATAFKQKFLAALARERKWNAGQALDFQSDLQIYEDVLAKSGAPRRGRKPYEGAHHPFVDRCAFLLDSSFMEKARVASNQALSAIERLASALAEEAWRNDSA